jgi:guanine nucleotide-binding protein subunit alpha
MVTAVIFLTAINEYDMVLEEDVKTNRLLESLTLWHALTCAPHFKSTPFILFLNKSDLFKQKIEKGPLSEVFLDFNEVTSAPEFATLNLYDKSWNYILRQFKSRFGGFKFFHHVTNVLDTKLCQKVFENVQHVIIELALSRVGL